MEKIQGIHSDNQAWFQKHSVFPKKTLLLIVNSTANRCVPIRLTYQPSIYNLSAIEQAL